MIYKKHNIVDGDVLNSSVMNKISDAINSISPNSHHKIFKDGEILYGNDLNNITNILSSIDVEENFNTYLDGEILYAKDIDIIEQSIVKNSINWDIKPYYKDTIESVINNITEIYHSRNKNEHIEFIVLADMHKNDINSSPEFYRMCENIKYLTYMLDIKFVANLGDLCFCSDGDMDVSVYDELVTYFSEFNAPYIITTGNHDYIPHNKRREIATNSKAAVFDDYGSWLYIDDDEHKIRIILLDSQDIGGDAMNGNTVSIINSSACSGRSWKQLDWLANVALKTSYSIICMEHQGLGLLGSSFVRLQTYINNYKIAKDIFEGFQKGESGSKAYNKYHANETNVKDYVTWDFTEQGKGTLICHLFGHVHGDNNFNINTSTATPFNEITFENALCRDGTYVGTNYKRTIDTLSEIAFDVISIDLINKEMKCFRIGAGKDRTIQLL